VEPAPLGAAPGFLQPVGRWCCGADEILHAHDDDGRFAAPVDDEALVVLDGEVHDLPELGTGEMSVNAMIHAISHLINQSMHASKRKKMPSSSRGERYCRCRVVDCPGTGSLSRIHEAHRGPDE